MRKTLKLLVLLFVIITATFLVVTSFAKKEPKQQKDSSVSRNAGSAVCRQDYGMSFPPFKDQEQIGFTLQELEKLGINKIRLAIDWKNREPQKRKYNWRAMDLRMQKAKEHNLSVLLTIPSDGPTWACSDVKNEKSCVFSDESDFRDFVTKILIRYKGAIDKIQFGNEWDNTYAGSMEEFVKYNNLLYHLTKEFSPETKVVLGGITRAYPIVELHCNQKKKLDLSDISFSKGYSQERILSKIERDHCNSDVKQKVLYVLEKAKYDMLDIHLYDDPLNWEAYLELLPKEKPILVTEFGGPSSMFERTDQEYQAKRMGDYLRVIEKLPIEEAYYFKLVDSRTAFHKDTGLFDEKLHRKKAYDVFAGCRGLNSK